MRIYFDTEFTTLDKRIERVKLISAGFVAEDGQELYFELSDSYEEEGCSDFVAEHVLPNLDEKHSMTTLEAVNKLADWIESYNEEVQLCTDAPSYDWALLRSVMQKRLPKNLRLHPVNVYSERVDRSMGHYFNDHPEAIRHHALCDARALSHACMANAW